MLKRQKGFTLSELLVSLAVLGLIAAVSIPSVYNSVKSQREKAVWKETFSALANATFEGAASGELTTGNITAFLGLKLNAVRVCSHAQNQGCWSGSSSSGPNNANEGGLVLPNGVMITDIESSNGERVWIDIN